MSAIRRHAPSFRRRSLGLALTVACCGALLPASQAQAQDGTLSELAWLAGCWASDGAEAGSGEQWMAPGGGSLLGMSRTVRRGKTVAYEFMQIREGDDGKLGFVAQPSGQKTTRFPLLRMSTTEAVFENLAHDFPQRVIYASDDGKLLRARIEGNHKGAPRAIDFPMRRVACEAGPPAATGSASLRREGPAGEDKR